MRWPIWAFAICLILQGTAFADTLFENRDGSDSIQSYQKYLRGVRAKLFDKDEDTREDAFERIEDSLKQPPLEGDAEFPLALLGDLMLGTERPAEGHLDVELQEDGLELLIDNAKDEESSISRREFALGQLRRIVRAKKLGQASFRNDTFAALISLSEDPRPVLAHGALNALAAIATRAEEEWQEKGEEAAEVLIDLLDDDNLEVRRFAILETVQALHKAARPGSTTDSLWKELADALEDIESPSLQKDLRPRLTRLADARKDSPFASLAEELREELDEFDARAKPSEGIYREVLDQLREEEDLEELEALLARIEAEGRTDPTQRAIGLTAMMAKASNPEIGPYILRVLLDSLVRQGRVPGSPIMYYRTATQLLDLAFTHRNNGKANTPLAQLARLLASTDLPGLVVPVLDEIRTMAMAESQPVWIGRRMTALLFLQAGDSPNDKIRLHALQMLEETGKLGRNWAIRQEVWNRISQLARFARDEEIKARAVRWLRG